jgi:predicted nucleic-acid-binding protein
MIGLDTNVIVRYIAQDDAVQSAQATQLIESLSRLSYAGIYGGVGLGDARLL